MEISIRYRYGRYGGVSAPMLNVLLREDQIDQFFRYSEKRWVTVGLDRIRQDNDPGYASEGRRHSDKITHGKLSTFERIRGALKIFS
jgi:hypothetical protein